MTPVKVSEKTNFLQERTLAVSPGKGISSAVGRDRF